MFDSEDYGGKDLLFKDSTQSLVDVGDKNTHQKWLGDDFFKAFDALNCDTSTSGAGTPVLNYTLMILSVLVFFHITV